MITYTRGTRAKAEIQMADIGSGAFFIIPNTPTNGDAVQVLITAQSGQENGITVGIYDAANNLVGNTLSVSAGGYTSALTFNFNSSSSQHTVRVTGNGNPANNHNVFVNGHQQTWTAIGSGSTNYNSGTQQQEITVNADNDGGKVSFSTAANTGQDLFVKVSIQAGGSDVTAGVYDQNGNLVSATDVITAGNSGDLNLVVSNCSSSIHEVRLTGELVQVMTPVTLLNNGHTLTWTAWNSGSATYNSGNNTQDITATNAGDGAYYTITGTPTNGNVIDVNLTFTTTTNPVYVGLYDNSNNLVAGPTTVPVNSTNQLVNFNLNSSQNQYNLRATSDPVMTIAPSQTVTNGHTQTWSTYNSGSPTYNSGTSTQDVPVTAANDGASFFFSTPNTGEYVNGNITVQAVSNNAVVCIYDNSGNPVTGNFTINAGNTTQVNFNFNSADIQHEVRVVSQLTGGGSYPDIFYISALDIWVTDTTYSPYTFSVSQFAVVETTYVPTADVFYVTDLDVTASPYPEKCFVSNLDVNYTVNVTRPVCSSMEEFLANTKGYRFGFNGKEHDDETYGNGNIYDYGFRIYNPRIGKFLSVDPLSPKYPWYTSYQFAGNKPIWAIDLDGAEELIVTYFEIKDGKKIELTLPLIAKTNGNWKGQRYISQYFVHGPTGVTFYGGESPGQNELAMLKDGVKINEVQYMDNFNMVESYKKFRQTYRGQEFESTVINYVTGITMIFTAGATSTLQISSQATRLLSSKLGTFAVDAMTQAIAKGGFDKIDWGDAATSALIKNKAFSNVVKSLVDIDSEGFDIKKANEALLEFGLRLVVDKVNAPGTEKGTVNQYVMQVIGKKELKEMKKATNAGNNSL